MVHRILTYRFNIIDFFFFLFVISTILMGNSYIGKLFQLFFVLLTLIYLIRNMKIQLYHIFEWIFIAYVFIQVVAGIAEVPSATMSMGTTLIYTGLFSLGTYNYFVYSGNDINKLVNIYVVSSVVGLSLVTILFFNTIISPTGLDASSNISLGSIVIFGGSSSTSLAMQAVIPAFIVILFSKENRKRALNYFFFFLFIALLTGTRKILILFAYILLVEFTLVKPGVKNFKLLKILFLALVGTIIGYFTIMKIPILYEIIGYRIQNTIMYYQTGTNDDASMIVRNRMIEESYNLFQQKKLLGWGMDYYKYSGLSDLGYYSHNNFLELLAGGGIIGFVLYYMKYLYLFLAMIKKSIHVKTDRYYWVACLGFMILMTIIEFWQVTYFYRYIVIYQVFLLAIIGRNYSWEDTNTEKKNLM